MDTTTAIAKTMRAQSICHSISAMIVEHLENRPHTPQVNIAMAGGAGDLIRWFSDLSSEVVKMQSMISSYKELDIYVQNCKFVASWGGFKPVTEMNAYVHHNVARSMSYEVLKRNVCDLFVNQLRNWTLPGGLLEQLEAEDCISQRTLIKCDLSALPHHTHLCRQATALGVTSAVLSSNRRPRRGGRACITFSSLQRHEAEVPSEANAFVKMKDISTRIEQNTITALCALATLALVLEVPKVMVDSLLEELTRLTNPNFAQIQEISQHRSVNCTMTCMESTTRMHDFHDPDVYSETADGLYLVRHGCFDCRESLVFSGEDALAVKNQGEYTGMTINNWGFNAIQREKMEAGAHGILYSGAADLWIADPPLVGSCKESRNIVILPGSFNPLHRGHLSMLYTATDHVAKVQGQMPTSLFEMSLSNFDKPNLEFGSRAFLERLSVFKALRLNILLTKASLFTEKINVLGTLLSKHSGYNKSATSCNIWFAIGWDTMIRITSTYDDPQNCVDEILKVARINSVNVKFIVFPRNIKGYEMPDGSTDTNEGQLKAINTALLEQWPQSKILPTKLFEVFIPIGEKFRKIEVSSSDIRKRRSK